MNIFWLRNSKHQQSKLSITKKKLRAIRWTLLKLKKGNKEM